MHFKTSNPFFTYDPPGRKTAETNARQRGYVVDEAFKRLELHDAEQADKLTDNEVKALHFITEELLLKRNPSVRDVAYAVGLKSSRSGARLIHALIRKGRIMRIQTRLRLA